MKLFKTVYKAGKDGKIEKKYIFNGEELATKSDVYEWHLKGRSYTDACYIRSKLAIILSIISMAISIIFGAICMLFT